MHLKIKGSALLTALFIVTIVAIIVTSMLSRLRIDIHHANLTIESDKLYLASQIVNYWAIDEIKQAYKPFKVLDESGKILIFPAKYHKIYPGIYVSGAVYDLQAKFNLNNLTDEGFKGIFYQLIGEVNPKINKQKRRYLVEAVANWIKESNPNQTQHDEWLDKYLALKPPYLPSHQKMSSKSELRAVLDINPKIYTSLESYISALPETTTININTASKQLLNSLSIQKEKKLIKNIMQLRANKPITNLSEVSAILDAAKIPSSKLSVSSNYFLIVSRSRNADINFTNYTTIKLIRNKDNSVRVDTLKQSFNTE